MNDFTIVVYCAWRECLIRELMFVFACRMIQQAQQGHHHKTPSSDDKLRRFLEFSGMVLSFDCVLDETDRPGGELISFKMYFYLEDDTVAIKERPENQQGRDGFVMLLKRTKLPKNWQKKPADFPAIAFNVSDAEVEEYYQPKDFMIGGTIFVFGRKFLLLDCDKFTRNYFDKVLRCLQPNRLEIQKPTCPEIKVVSSCSALVRRFDELNWFVYSYRNCPSTPAWARQRIRLHHATILSRSLPRKTSFRSSWMQTRRFATAASWTQLIPKKRIGSSFCHTTCRTDWFKSLSSRFPTPESPVESFCLREESSDRDRMSTNLTTTRRRIFGLEHS